MPSEHAAHWALDPAITFLNHGSFGACPRPVLEAQRRWRDRLEAQPVQFFARDLPGLLATARGELGAFVGADPDDLAFVANATGAVNAIVRSLRFAPGDEDQVMAPRGEQGRNVEADAAGGTGDEGEGARRGHGWSPVDGAAIS